jgi:hypothetical protein
MKDNLRIGLKKDTENNEELEDVTNKYSLQLFDIAEFSGITVSHQVSLS